jgi:outer membrane murein-binding lipoprotein Lpp
MTTEERLTRIENAIYAVVETQARHEAQFEKQSAGIGDLIVVSRTLVDAQLATDNTIKQLSGTVDQLSGTVDQLSGTVDQLIATVDRLATTVDTLVKSFQKPNGNQ